ncbi:MAG TPA: exonuclease domain-containing protein, partial [Lacibacter sp.]|nr:exonuclease domain-containing protein [Lacibacter sp.]
MLYAITDIETTGGHAAGNGITEIAVYIHDGQRVVDRFETLVNPGQSIPYFIQRLTGITEEMVALAPRFEDLAPRLYGLLQGKVFVAHNVNFDYSFLLHHLQANGFQLNCKKLCTVRYSRKLLPGLPSYSLGNLCRHLSIPLQHRHRATGDAQATVQLFELLCSKDVNNIRHTLLSRQSGEHNLPLFVNREEVERLPVGPGVYYFHDAKGKVIYVGKAVRLKQRVLGHFSTNNATRQRQEFIRNIHRISYRVCGTGLMASVLEAVEIKRLWPKYNKATKQPEAAYGWYIYEDNGGYLRLAVDRKRRHLPAVQLFFNPTEARGALRRFADAHALC